MIVILEGANGVGKSTYAHELELGDGLRLYRAFRRGNTELHWGAKEGGEEAVRTQLEALGIPLNTYIDDLYLADFIQSFSLDAVLDRSLPSAIAYDSLDLLQGATAGQLLEAWQKMMACSVSPVLYVWLKTSYRMAKERVNGRHMPTGAEYGRLNKYYERLFNRIRLPKLAIDTGRAEVREGMKMIRNKCQLLTT